MSYKSKRGSAIRAIAGAAIALAALIAVIAVIGDPAGRSPRTANSGAGTQPTTQSVATEATKETESTQKPTESETTTTAETTTATETTVTETTTAETTAAPDGKAMNPKNYEEAIDTEREASKRVYLTFDDGPSVHTNEILDILKKYGIKATFFNIAVNNDDLKAAEKRAYDEGHTLAIHSVSHDYEKVYDSFDAWKADVLGEQENIKNNTGITTKYYRFPGGTSNSKGAKYGTDISQCVNWLDENGYLFFDWNVDSKDADGQVYTADQLASNVIEAVRDSSGEDFIVLMHDAKPKTTTVEALPKVIETLKSEGYTFCQITDNTTQLHHHLYEG